MRLFSNFLLLICLCGQPLWAQEIDLVGFPTDGAIGRRVSFQFEHKLPVQRLVVTSNLPREVKMSIRELPPVANRRSSLVEFTPTQLVAPARYTFSFFALGSAGDTLARRDATLQIANAHNPPSVSPRPLEFVIQPGGHKTLPFQLDDPDKDSLVCQIESSPECAPALTSQLTLRVAPINQAAGQFELDLRATNAVQRDGSCRYLLVVKEYRRGESAPFSRRLTFPIQVSASAATLPPRFNKSPNRLLTFIEGTESELPLTARDENEDIEQYSIVLTPPTQLDASKLISSTGTFKWALPHTTVANGDFTRTFKALCTVRDKGGLKDTLNLVIRVMNKLQPEDITQQQAIYNDLQNQSNSRQQEVQKALSQANKRHERDKVFTFATLATGLATTAFGALETTNSRVADSDARPYLTIGFGTLTALFQLIRVTWPYQEDKVKEYKIRQAELEKTLAEFNANYLRPTTDDFNTPEYHESRKRLQTSLDAIKNND